MPLFYINDLFDNSENKSFKYGRHTYFLNSSEN